MKRILTFILALCTIISLTACGETATQLKEYIPVNEGVLCGVEFENMKVEVLSYEFDENWHSYADVEEGPAVIVRFYYENDNAEPYYLLESFGIFPYQDGVELDYISLNSEDEECTNVAKSVKDGTGIYCKMVFSTTSENDVVLLIQEPTADAKQLASITMTKSE